MLNDNYAKNQSISSIPCSICQYIFPFDKVDKDSKIIIYGAGKIGKQFVDQIQSLNYCECLFVIDKNYKKIQKINDIDVYAPEQIKICKYDKVVIASNTFADKFYNTLLELNVPDNKIVTTIYKKIVITNNEDGKVYIHDYKYTPKYRDSLKNSRIGQILEEWYADNKNEVIALVKRFCSFKQQYERIPLNPSTSMSIRWENAAIPPFDAISIYGFLAEKNPRYYIEVGSGNTTLFAAQSIRDNNLRTKIISIDPFPRRDIDELCYKIYRIPLEDINLDFFDEVSADDIFLIDGSHRSFPNSDATVFFTEILPKLPTGTLYAIHDIFLPEDYPDYWSNTQRRWYNEQYLLCAYLLGGSGGDKIKCPNSFLSNKDEFIEACSPLWGNGCLFDGMQIHGGFFWMEKA